MEAAVREVHLQQLPLHILTPYLRRRKYFIISIIKKHLPAAFKMQNRNTYYIAWLSSTETAKLTASMWE